MTAAHAQVAQAKEIKIGIMNLQLALNQSEEGKKVLSRLKANLAKEQDIITSKKEELVKMEEELRSQGYMMSEKIRKEKEQRLRKLNREFERYREDKQAEFVSEQRDATARIYKDLMAVLKKYAKEQGYTLVLEGGQKTPGVPGSLIYSDDEIDITKAVMDLYNK
jgi:outer membrane protein